MCSRASRRCEFRHRWKRRPMTMGAIVRRSTLGTAAIGLALIAAGCSNSRTPVAPASAAAEDHSLQGDPSLGPELAAVRGATAQFHDVSAAMAAGYLNPAGRVCDQIAIGTMGIH